VPPLPGLPESGRGIPFPPFSQLVTLKAFRVFSGSDRLLVDASATFTPPLPSSIELTVPSLPLEISLPHQQNDTSVCCASPIVHLETDPLTLTHPNTTIHVHGHSAPLARDSLPPLSSFLVSYLNGESPGLCLSIPVLPGFTLNTVFPAPDPRPQVLQDVIIKDMKIRPLTSNTMLASGTVLAKIVLPKGVDVLLNVDTVYPQLLVYDGPVPNGGLTRTERTTPDIGNDGLPKPMPLPDPLPADVFAHIRPEEWIVSRSVPLGHESEQGSVFAVSAKMVDIPLRVLPGKQKEFSNFVRKVRGTRIECSPFLWHPSRLYLVAVKVLWLG
jgi:hypothetical protein